MELIIWIYTILSVMMVSAISLIGVFFMRFKDETLRKIILYFVSFSAGSLFGDAFIHLIPEASSNGFTISVGLMILSGILVFFIFEKMIHWHHCNLHADHEYPHRIGHMSLLSDGFHNFMDGILIGGSFMVSPALGLATTLAVIFHEIPQELGDFSILLHAGFKRKKALLYNFLSGLTAVLGAVLVLLIGTRINGVADFLIAFTAGGFIYIAGSDLIPELHKHCLPPGKSILHILSIMLGMGIMLALLLVG
jgi:zinc and cadmium transporter